MVLFESISGQLIFGQIRSSCQNKQLCGKFRIGYGMGRVESIRVSGEHISGVRSGMDPGRLVWVSSLESVLPGLDGRRDFLFTLKEMTRVL